MKGRDKTILSRPFVFIPLQQNWLIYLRFDDLRCTIEVCIVQQPFYDFKSYINRTS